MRIAVLGAGAWGTALATSAAARHEVTLWARDPAQVAAMRAARRNARYLPDIELPGALDLSADLPSTLQACGGGLVVVATPMAALGDMLVALPAEARVLWLCKGFQAGSGLLGHELAQALVPRAQAGVLSGPSFAQEVARGLPAALVAASKDAALADLAVDLLHSERLRIYKSSDPVGVEVGGAVKNVIAIATGIADGLALGMNARAALIARGLAEMTRLGVALGARAETFLGLAGVGDLVLTATGDLSRNRRVGLLLAAGRSLPQILQELGHVAEGVYSAATVLARARACGVEMPITSAVVDVLEGRLAPGTAALALMGRGAGAEL
ncbi:MAG TPA: NAD(P)H-dependent glycerol-3-phosphate dehydrogenase [Burkholderiaceae bacterium]|nr:NAD(P)H-dependent glycerol-3-phosphate dehydrogenase [Burkholderiaceae bacterium]